MPSTEGPPDVAAASQTSILFEAAAADTPAGLRCRRLLRTVPVRRHLASTRPASQGWGTTCSSTRAGVCPRDAPIVAFFGGPASSRRPGGGRAGGLGALARPPTHSAWRGPVVGTHLGRYAGPPCVGALLPDGNRVLMDSDSLCAFNVPGSEMAVRAAAMAPRARSYLERPPCSCKLHSDAPLIGTAMPSRCSRCRPPVAFLGGRRRPVDPAAAVVVRMGALARPPIHGLRPAGPARRERTSEGRKGFRTSERGACRSVGIGAGSRSLAPPRHRGSTACSMHDERSTCPQVTEEGPPCHHPMSASVHLTGGRHPATSHVSQGVIRDGDPSLTGATGSV